jgi:hypothetical protein
MKFPKSLKNGLLALALFLIVGRFASQTYARMLTNSNSAEGDQLAFLQLGLDLREHGTLTDGTRNPLYTVFLALMARREWSYFTMAKLLSLLFGLAAILAVFWLARRRFDTFTGLVAAYLLSINVEFIVHSAQALTESLLVLTFVLAWFAMLKALDRPGQPGYWALAGALAGLSYLAKGSAQLLVFSFLLLSLGIAVASSTIGRFFRGPGLWTFLAAYALVVSPLWIYSSLRFGSPTFNYAITHQMWLDSWREWHPDDLDHLPTAVSYLQTHSPSEIFQRQWDGMKAMRNILIKTLWPTRTLLVDRFLLSPLSGWLLGGLVALPFLLWPLTRRYLRQQGRPVGLTLLVSTLFFLLFAWYVPIVALGQRFLLPVVPLIFILMAHLAGQLGRRLLAGEFWVRQLVLLWIAIIIGMQLRWAIQTSLEPARALFTQNIFAQDRQFNSDSATPLAWLVHQSPGRETVAWGPSGKSLPVWAYSNRLEVKLYPPEAGSLADLTANLVSRDIDYLILDADMLSRYRDLLQEHFSSDGTHLEIEQIPPDWALTYAYRAMPCEWCIFRLLPTAPAQQPVDYRLGTDPANAPIALVGYDLAESEAQPGATLHLTLHWAALAPLEQSYTVFTQLIGPDLQLYGQLDHPPLDNLWPTTHWQPGDRLADRYDLPINPAAPPGVYQLLVGMYQPQTGQRVPVTQYGQPVPDHAIRLATITIGPQS